jgi:hypothetical protein
MNTNRGSARALVKTFGLALLSVIALVGIGASAAQAYTPIWAVDNYALKAGEKKASTIKGPDANFKIKTPGTGVVFNCKDVNATGVIAGPSGGEVSLVASDCEIPGAGAKWCKVQPINIDMQIGLTEDKQRYVETFTPKPFWITVKDPEGGCWWWAENLQAGAGGSLGVELGEDPAKVQNLTGLQEFTMNWVWGKEPFTAYLEGPLTQELASGQTFMAV